MTDFGSDVSTYAGNVAAGVALDPTMKWITGTRAVAERCMRRLSTPRGTLAYAPDDGYDLTDLLNKDSSPNDIFVAQHLATLELEKDDEIQSAQITLALNSATDTLTVTVAITLSGGASFAFVFDISDVTASNLRQLANT